MKSKRQTPFHKEAERSARLRRERIASLVERGYSDAQIGKMMDPPISRQRVGQLFAARGGKDG